MLFNLSIRAHWIYFYTWMIDVACYSLLGRSADEVNKWLKASRRATTNLLFCQNTKWKQKACSKQTEQKQNQNWKVQYRKTKLYCHSFSRQLNYSSYYPRMKWLFHFLSATILKMPLAKNGFFHNYSRHKARKSKNKVAYLERQNRALSRWVYHISKRC